MGGGGGPGHPGAPPEAIPGKSYFWFAHRRYEDVTSYQNPQNKDQNPQNNLNAARRPPDAARRGAAGARRRGGAVGPAGGQEDAPGRKFRDFYVFMYKSRTPHNAIWPCCDDDPK